MVQYLVGQSASSMMAPYFQTEGSGAGIPWWIWLVIISVLLLLLFIGIARQSGPGEPLPKPEDRLPAPLVAAEVKEPDSQPESPGDVAEEAEESQNEAGN